MLVFFWLQMTEIQFKGLRKRTYQDLGLSVSWVTRAEMWLGLRNSEARGFMYCQDFPSGLLFPPLCICLFSELLSLILLPVSLAHRAAHISLILLPVSLAHRAAHMGLHLQSLGTLATDSAAGKRKVPSVPIPELLGKERIVLAWVRCPPWTNLLRPGARHIVHNGSSCDN
jgi:hypothetical protein